MIRKSDCPKTREIPANPLENFRRASWAEALEFAASGLIKVRENDGGNALAGFGSAKGSNEEAYLVQKLVRTGFGTNNVDHCTRLCHASSVSALMETIGSGAVTAPFSEAENAEVIIVIGANPTVNHPVAATFIKNAVKGGSTLIVMDPRGQALTRHATHMIQFKPSSDVAMLNGMINTIISEELYDQQYIDGYTEGFEELKKQTKQFTPERMAPICGIEANKIREIARIYAKANSALIFWGMGVSQHTHGTDNARCLISLALICGHVGRPGTGLHPLRGQNNVQGASDAGLIPMFYPDYKSVTDKDQLDRWEKFWSTDLDREKGLTVVEITDAMYERTIKGAYIMGENPAMSDPDQNHTREALSRLEHLVVQDIFLTETAAFADVILPATAFPEKDGTFTNTDRRVQLGRKAVPAPGEAKQDWWIIQEIAQRMGLSWNYTEPRDIFADGYPTESGRGKLVPCDILPPNEVPDSKFPLVLTTGRLLEHWHTGSMTRRATVLDRIEPEAFAHINPDDLTQWNLVPGEEIRVETRRGSIELFARSDADVPTGVVFVPFCYSEAAVNFLTNPALDPFGKIPELKFSAARLEKVAQKTR